MGVPPFKETPIYNTISLTGMIPPSTQSSPLSPPFEDPQKPVGDLDLGHELLRDLRWTQAERLELRQVRHLDVPLDGRK